MLLTEKQNNPQVPSIVEEDENLIFSHGQTYLALLPPSSQMVINVLVNC
jgi:hypothetical protein